MVLTTTTILMAALVTRAAQTARPHRPTKATAQAPVLEAAQVVAAVVMAALAAPWLLAPQSCGALA